MPDNFQTDLIALVERDLGPGKKSGRWSMFRCPFHQERHPSFAVTNGDKTRGPGFRCYACGKHGGPVTWLMEYHQMTLEDAKQALKGNYAPSLPQKALQPSEMPMETPPGAKWQQRAREIVKRAEDALWSEKGAFEILEWQETDPDTGKTVLKKLSALDWLFSRGLTEKTLRAWHIGYIPVTWHDQPEKWGLQSSKKVFLPKGVLIPGIVGKHAWYMKIRQPAGNPKYIHVPGSKPALYMAQELDLQDTAVFCEGELDALLLWQEAGYLTGVVTLGSANNELNTFTWGLYLLNIHHWYTAYDQDKAGDQGSRKLDKFHARQLNIPRLKPHDKDLTDFFKSGGDLSDWLKSEFRRLNPSQE